MILLGLRQIRPAVPVISQHVIPRPLISPISGSRAISCRKCAPGSQFGTHMRAAYSTLQSLKTTALRLSDEVEAAIQSNIPIVALETTIYTHGFPYPDNVALALNLESVVRRNGAIPATIGVLNGVARVGLSSEEITTLASSAGKPETMKVSRRDLPYILGMGIAGKRLNGGTTVAGTMYLAERAGIKVFGTGGLGGVHRGGQDTMDVSADLTELGRTNVAVISSGCKSFLDIPRTLEYLETQGVMVSTFADGRTGDIDFPAFYTRKSGVRSPTVVQNAREAAAIIYANYALASRSQSGLLFANPIPEEYSIAKAEIDIVINQAVQEAAEQGFHGHANTPFILARIKELTKGNSIPANRALIESNVAMAAKVALELSKLKKDGFSFVSASVSEGNAGMGTFMPAPQRNHESQDDLTSGQTTSSSEMRTQSNSPRAPNILIFGSLAVDLSCDYAPSRKSKGMLAAHKPTDVSPHMHTSNIATITPSIGGVGYNVALAAKLAGSNLAIKLCSFVADDLAGAAAISAMENHCMDTSGITTLPLQSLDEGQPPFSTAQYVAVNDANKDLVLAMADMSIFSSDNGPRPIVRPDLTPLPELIVIDANWSPSKICDTITRIRSVDPKSKIVFEPVSVAKSAAIFEPLSRNQPHPLKCFPNHLIDLAAPNKYELASMHASAKEHEFFASDAWWHTIDSLGIPSSGARDRFVALTNREMTDEGIPLQKIQLLPLIPRILTKLGADGVLLTELLKPGDTRLTNPSDAPYILSRCKNGSKEVGGVYMRLFPAVEQVPAEDVVSVNGVGDTFLGVLIAGLAKDVPLDEGLINIAQRGAVMTLKSKEAVAPQVEDLFIEIDHLAGYL